MSIPRGGSYNRAPLVAVARVAGTSSHGKRDSDMQVPDRHVARTLTFAALCTSASLLLAQCASTNANQVLEIRTVSGAARNITRLTQSPDDELHPTVSPDGKLVAFQVLKNGQFDIYALDTTTGVSRVQVTDHPGHDIDPTWSGDSRTIVFSSNRLGSYSLWKQLASGGGGCTMLTRGADMMDFAPAVSPTTATVCFHSRGVGNASYVVSSTGASEYAVYRKNLPHIWKVSSAGNELTQFGEGAYPTWDPDGSRVAFCSDTGGDWDIWMMQNDGSGLTQLAMPKDQLSPCFCKADATSPTRRQLRPRGS